MRQDNHGPPDQEMNAAKKLPCEPSAPPPIIFDLAALNFKLPFIMTARNLGVEMKKLSKALTAAAILSLSASALVTPAYALGGCGPNGHRNGWGRCVFGGQNQAWCLRRTGHPAVRMPDGTLRCF